MQTRRLGPETEDENGDTSLDICRELEVALVAYDPLGHGLLTGAIEDTGDLDEADFRHRLPRFQAENVEHNVGTRRPEHVESDLAVADIDLDASTLERLDEAVPSGAVKGTQY